MRPLRLRMSAFGPYGGTEEIDFREAVDAGLFGIFGPTGAGKSSIFSAMTFALFGEAARGEQSTASLRSDHAHADTLTSVSLLFSVGGKRYLIRREPEQKRPKLRGPGDTPHAHAAYLHDVSAIAVEDVDLQGAGAIVAEKKIGLVNAAVRGLLGYGCDQFRQIVLLPQGRFEKFLLANSDERLAILRDLFDVSLFRELTERLKLEAADAVRAHRERQQLMVARLADQGFESDAALAIGIEDAKAAAAAVEGVAAAAQTAATAAGDALMQAEQLERRFVALATARQALEELQGEQPRIDALERKLHLVRQVQQSVDLHAAIGSAQKAVEQADAAGKRAEADLLAADKAVSQAKHELAQAEGKAPEAEGLRATLQTLSRYRETLAGAQDLRDGLADLTERFARSEAALEEAEQAFAMAQQGRNTLIAQREAELVAAAERASLTSRRLELGTEKVGAEAHHRATAALADAQDQVGRAIDGEGHAKANLGLAEREAAAAEHALTGARAGTLAQHLENGAPCPVCGSVEHPEPALAGEDERAAAASLRLARYKLTAAQGIYAKATVNLSVAQQRVADCEAALTELEEPHRARELVEIDLADVEQALAEIEPAPSPVISKEQVQSATDAAKAAEEALPAVRTAQEQSRAAHADAKLRYEIELNSVPKAYREDHRLEEAARTAQAALNQITQTIDAARMQEAQAREHKASAEATLTSAQSQLATAADHVEVAEASFAARLGALGLPRELFDRHLPDVTHISELEADVASHRDKLTHLQGRVEEARVAVDGQQRPDLDPLRAHALEATDTAQQERKRASDASTRAETLQRLRDSLKAERAALLELDAATGPLRAVAEACNGDNELRLSLETYAIGAMFDRVLAAANLRLEPMTAGRYRLERDQMAVGGRTRRGLDLLVHDVQTGRPRPIPT